METASEVGGSVSVNCSMKTDMERRIVTPRLIFSPDSGGKVKPSSVIELITRVAETVRDVRVGRASPEWVRHVRCAASYASVQVACDVCGRISHTRRPRRRWKIASDGASEERDAEESGKRKKTTTNAEEMWKKQKTRKESVRRDGEPRIEIKKSERDVFIEAHD